MKTLLVSVLFSLAVVACNSDDSSALVTPEGGIPQGQQCTSTAQCESPLTCAYPIVPDAGVCPANPVAYCVAMGQCDYESVCPCGSSTAVTVCVTSVYATEPINPPGTGTCSAGATDGGGTTPTTDASPGGSTTGG